MKFIAGLLVLAGMVLGIGYPLYQANLSGKKLGEWEIQRDRFSPPRPLTVNLDPAMSPVSFSLTARVENRTHSRWNEQYRTALYLDRKPVFDKQVRLEVDEKDATGTINVSRHVAELDVTSAGAYELVVREERNLGAFRAQSMSVEIRRNVKPVEMRLVWIGFGLIGAGFLLGFLFGGVQPAKPD